MKSSVVFKTILLGITLSILAACTGSASKNSNSDNVKVYQTYKDVLKDASKYKDTELSRFFENEDICGVAIFENGSVKYFSVEECDVWNECKHNIIWRIKDGALEYITMLGIKDGAYTDNIYEGMSIVLTIIDGYYFYGEYRDGLCWNGDGIGYAPTKSNGKELKKFLWKGYYGDLWAHLEPESEAGQSYELESYESVAFVYSGFTNDSTYRNGTDRWYYVRW